MPDEFATTTADLIRRARSGDDEAYDQLFALAAERVLLFIRMRLDRKLRGRVEAMDVLQETYAEAHRSFDRFEYRGDKAFTRWLCRVADYAIKGLRDRYTAQKRDPGGERLPVSGVLERMRASQTGPATRAERREHHEQLEAALEQLAEEERQAIVLRHFRGCTYADIAEELGCSASSARRLLGRAMVRLGRRMGAGGEQ